MVGARLSFICIIGLGIIFSNGFSCAPSGRIRRGGWGLVRGVTDMSPLWGCPFRGNVIPPPFGGFYCAPFVAFVCAPFVAFVRAPFVAIFCSFRCNFVLLSSLLIVLLSSRFCASFFAFIGVLSFVVIVAFAACDRTTSIPRKRDAKQRRKEHYLIARNGASQKPPKGGEIKLPQKGQPQRGDISIVSEFPRPLPTRATKWRGVRCVWGVRIVFCTSSGCVSLRTS